jgi:hypothetical protein
MAQVEFTQQFNVAYENGDAFYVQLQSTPGVYIIKGLTCYSSVGVASVGSDSLSIISAANGSGGGIRYIYSTNATIPAWQIIPIFNPSKQVVLTQPYLGFRAVGVDGNLIIQISYSFFPSSSPISASFGSTYYSLTAPSTGATLTGTSATIPLILKSLIVVNNQNESAISITPLLTTPTTTNLAFDITTSVPAGQSYEYTLPLYITNNMTVSIESNPATGTPLFSVVYSYTQDLNS